MNSIRLLSNDKDIDYIISAIKRSNINSSEKEKIISMLNTHQSELQALVQFLNVDMVKVIARHKNKTKHSKTIEF